MSYIIQYLLGLQGLVVHLVLHHFQEVHLVVSPRRKTGTCPLCGKRSHYVHGYRPPQYIKHILVGEQQLYLVLHKRRFFCRHCEKTFVEEIPGLSKWSRHTKRLEAEILSRLKESSFAAVTRTTNLSYRTQTKTLLTKVNPSTPKWETVKKPFVMGLDEQSFSGHDMLATVTDLTHHKLLCVLPNDRKSTISSFYDSIPEEQAELIQAICSDMRSTYSSARTKHPILKNIPLVIDKYHVIADANKRVNDERKIVQSVILNNKKLIPKKLLMRAKESLSPEEQEKLQEILSLYPDLKVYYFVKEAVREMYQKQTKEEATKLLNNLISMMWRQREKGCSDWAKTLERYHGGILNYFDFHITNAYTEGVHTKMKLIKRQGFGYKNKQIYMRKLMLGFLPFATLITPHLFQ